LWAQRKDIDSLLKVESKIKTKGDTTHIKLLCKISALYESTNLDSSLLLGEQAMEFAKKINYQKGIALSYTCIGYYYNAIGNCYIGYGKVEKALEAYLEGYEMALKYQFVQKQGILGIGVGNCYIELKEYQKALDYFLVTNEIFKAQQSDYLVSFSMLCIANALSGLERYDEAFLKYDSAIQVLEKLDNQYGKAAAYQEVATTYQKIKNYDKAIEYYKKSVAIFEERKAYDNLKKISLALAECFAEKNDFQQAYAYHVAYSGYNDSILNEKVNSQLLEVEGKYEAEKKQQEIELQNVLLSEKDAKLAEESLRNSLLYLIIGIVVLVMIIATIGYWTNRRNNQKLNAINHHLELKNQIIEEKTKEILDSINYAKNIQNAIIPPIETVRKYLPESFVLYLPKDIVAGDFYWIETTTPIPPPLETSPLAPSLGGGTGVVFFAVADCTGHGVPGALVSVVCSNALNRAIKEFNHTQTADILNKTRELVIETFNTSSDTIKDGMDISLAALTVQPNSENNELQEIKLQWSGANNPLWIVRKDAAVIEELKADKQPIGLSHQNRPFTQHECSLHKGDTLYMFTDGFADQFGGMERAGGKKFMYRRLKELILSIKQLPIEQQEKALLAQFTNWKGDFEQLDDVCIMGVRF
jgi:serine phosphatase RsbU (regulator of sigma subunit)